MNNFLGGIKGLGRNIRKFYVIVCFNVFDEGIKLCFSICNKGFNKGKSIVFMRY